MKHSSTFCIGRMLTLNMWKSKNCLTSAISQICLFCEAQSCVTRQMFLSVSSLPTFRRTLGEARNSNKFKFQVFKIIISFGIKFCD